MKPKKTAQQIYAEVTRLVEADAAVQEAGVEILLLWPSRRLAVAGGPNWAMRYSCDFPFVIALAVAHVQAMWDLR